MARDTFKKLLLICKGKLCSILFILEDNQRINTVFLAKTLLRKCLQFSSSFLFLDSIVN